VGAGIQLAAPSSRSNGWSSHDKRALRADRGAFLLLDDRLVAPCQKREEAARIVRWPPELFVSCLLFLLNNQRKLGWLL